MKIGSTATINYLFVRFIALPTKFITFLLSPWQMKLLECKIPNLILIEALKSSIIWITRIKAPGIRIDKGTYICIHYLLQNMYICRLLDRHLYIYEENATFQDEYIYATNTLKHDPKLHSVAQIICESLHVRATDFIILINIQQQIISKEKIRDLRVDTWALRRGIILSHQNIKY